MRTRLALAVFLSGASALLCGCDVLFPELDTPSPTTDAGVDAGTPHISGEMCALTDVRTFSGCSVGSIGGSFRVAVEETRDTIQADATGTFDLPTTGALASATLTVVDATGTYAPTVTVVHPTNGVLDGLAVPMVAVQTQETMSLESGFTLDPAKGMLLAWAVDATGAPIAGVRGNAISGAIGPLYDGASQDELDASTATGARGLIAQIDVAPGAVTLALTPPIGSTFAATSFTLPIRAGAVTMAALPIPTN